MLNHIFELIRQIDIKIESLKADLFLHSYLTKFFNICSTVTYYNPIQSFNSKFDVSDHELVMSFAV
jgi:hypothetical protein